MDLIERPDSDAARHPWERARARFFLGVLRAEGLLQRSLAVLDAGAGDAWLATELSERAVGAEITCWDALYTDEDLESLRRDAPNPLSFTADIPDGPFDLALLLDVLEHVEEDRPFLEALHERIALGGTLLFSVPAWPLLFSQHDFNLRHFRRYTPKSARRVLDAGGFEIVRGGGLFHSLLPARAAQKALEVMGDLLPGRRELTPDSAEHDLGWEAGPWFTRLVDSVLAADTTFSRLTAGRRVMLPGLSFWALCRRA